MRSGFTKARVYGLSLLTSRPVPGLAVNGYASTCGGPIGLTVHWGNACPDQEAGSGRWDRLHTDEEEEGQANPLFTIDRWTGDRPILRLRYADDTRFWIATDTWEVWADWPDSLTSEDASTYFLGPVLGYILRLRGLPVLHASAVAIPGASGDPEAAVALVGPPGAGKSTTAAAFARRGIPVLTEDVCALRLGDGPIEVLPGYPLIRLWPASVEMLYGRDDALPLITPTWDKRYLPLEGSVVGPSAGEPGAAPTFHDAPLPLRAVLLLAPREDSDTAPRIENLPPTEAFVHLVGNTYRNLLLDRSQREDEFRALHQLLEEVPVRRLVPHSDPAHLDAMVDLILQEYGG